MRKSRPNGRGERLMLQVTKGGVRVSQSSGTIERLRAEFERRQFVRLPRFLERDLLSAVCREVERGEFYERIHGGIGDNKELCLRDDSTASTLLHVLLNSAELFELVERVTGCGAIRCFRGRVYRIVPGHGHGDAWHSDANGRRLVSLSVNLSPRHYRGATLQMRLCGSPRILCQVPNLGLGDAILFRISSDLEHRISDIEGRAPKTAFAGWFQSKPTFRSLVAGMRESRMRRRRSTRSPSARGTESRETRSNGRRRTRRG